MNWKGNSTVAHQIRVVEENEVLEQPQPLRLAAPPESPVQTIHPEVAGAIKTLSGRLQAVETSIQSIPGAVGLLRALLRALGARILMFFALIGCLGLAGMAALWPSWQGLGIFCAFSALVYLPLAALTYFRGN